MSELAYIRGQAAISRLEVRRWWRVRREQAWADLGIVRPNFEKQEAREAVNRFTTAVRAATLTLSEQYEPIFKAFGTTYTDEEVDE